MTTTSTGLPIPVVDVQAARSAALRLRQASGAAEECLDELAAASPADWSGHASQSYLDGRALVSRRATDLAEACAVLDRAVVDFTEEAAAVLPRWRASAVRLEELERVAADPAVGGLDGAAPGRLEAVGRERDDLRVEVLAWERRFGDAEAALSAACSQVLAIVDDGRMSTADQLWAIPETVVHQMVVEPLGLASLLLDDPSQVDDVAKAMWFGTLDQIAHPRRTAEEMAGLPAYEDGRWGEGIGTGLVSMVGAIGLRRMIADVRAGRLTRPDGSPVWPPPAGTKGIGKNGWLTTQQLVQFQRHMDLRDSDAPIRTQTFDEMLAAPDLSRSEHPAMGHTLSRHVDADLEYVEFRLRTGTPENDGSIGFKPTMVSSWADRATAEGAIRRALDVEENAEARAAIAGGRDGSWTVVLREPDLGTVYRLRDAHVVSAPANVARIGIVRRNGELFVMTTRLSETGPAVDQ